MNDEFQNCLRCVSRTYVAFFFPSCEKWLTTRRVVYCKKASAHWRIVHLDQLRLRVQGSLFYTIEALRRSIQQQSAFPNKLYWTKHRKYYSDSLSVCGLLLLGVPDAASTIFSQLPHNLLHAVNTYIDNTISRQCPLIYFIKPERGILILQSPFFNITLWKSEREKLQWLETV